MRVMFLNPTGQLGGAESSLVDILASLRHAEPSWPLHLLAASDAAQREHLGETATQSLLQPRMHDRASVQRSQDCGFAAAGAANDRVRSGRRLRTRLSIFD